MTVPPPLTPQLLLDDGRPAVGRTIALPAAGLRLSLELPLPPGLAVAPPTRLLLTAARLALAAPPPADGALVEPGSNGAGATIDTDQGGVGWDEENSSWQWPLSTATPPAPLPVKWIVVDWGQPRELASLRLAGMAAGSKVRLKVSDGGSWYPPQMPDVFPATELFLPGITAAKLKIEIVTVTQGGAVEAAALVSGVTLMAANQARGISVAVGGDASFFHHPGPLPELSAGEPLAADGLVEAVNGRLERLSAAGESAAVPLIIRAERAGEIVIESFSAQAALSVRTLEGRGPEAGIKLPWEAPAEGVVKIAGGRLEELGFRLAYSPEKLLLGPDSIESNRASLCNPVFQTAQGFAPLPEGLALVGAELRLRPLTALLTGSAAFHPDDSGRPAAQPFPGAEVEIALEGYGQGPWPARWLSAGLPAPLVLGDLPWWLVLNLTAGEALWYLGPATGKTGGAMRRRGGGAWLPQTALGVAEEPPAQPSPLWALTRVLIDLQPGQAATTATISRGGIGMVAVPAPDGRVVLSPEQLKALNTDSSPEVRISVAARAAGEIIISQLEAGVIFA